MEKPVKYQDTYNADCPENDFSLNLTFWVSLFVGVFLAVIAIITTHVVFCRRDLQ